MLKRFKKSKMGDVAHDEAALGIVQTKAATDMIQVSRESCQIERVSRAGTHDKITDRFMTFSVQYILPSLES